MSVSKVRIALVAAVALAASLGCATLNSLGSLVGVRPPRFESAPGRSAEFRLVGPSRNRPYGGAALRLWARVENPNPFGVTLSTVYGRLLLDDTEAADV